MLRVGALEGGYEVEMLKANPSMKTYAGPAFEKSERERLSQLAKPKAALKPPVYAPETSTVIGEPISKQVGHSLDGPSSGLSGRADTCRRRGVRPGRPAGAASRVLIAIRT